MLLQREGLTIDRGILAAPSIEPDVDNFYKSIENQFYILYIIQYEKFKINGKCEKNIINKCKKYEEKIITKKT